MLYYNYFNNDNILIDMKKIAIQILLFWFFALPLAAQNFTATTPSGHTVNYKYVNGEPAGTVHVGAASDATYEGDLVIPSTVENEGITYTVIGTAYGAFKDKTGLTSITLGDSVHEINSKAFIGCTGLISVSMPGCTTIGEYAFYNCSVLTSVALSNCTTIGSAAFQGCTSLTSVDLSNCITIGGGAFGGCSNLTSVTLTQCTSIGSGAFQGCSSLTAVDLSNCTTINDYTFYGCSSLTAVDLSNCTNIDDYAFTSCSSLTSVDLSNCATIGGSAFRGCSSLTSVDLPSCTTIGASSFEGCGSLVSIKLSDACTSIGSSAFYGNTMPVLTIPDGIETIGDKAFSGTGILYYYGTATGSPWGAKYHNGVIADDLYNTINDDSTWTLHVGSSVTLIPSDELFNDHVSSIEVDAANSTFASSDGVLYSKNMKELKRVPAARSGNLAIGVGVISIAQKVFNGCRLIDTLFFNASKCVPPGSVPKFEMLKKNIGHSGNPVYIYLPSYTSGIFDTLTCINVLEVGDYEHGTEVTLTATPDEGYHFSQWSDGSTDNPMKVVVKSNLEYTAIFAIDQHEVTVNSADAAQGTVMGGGKVDYGGEATLTAQAKTGYHFSHWQDGNADNPRVVNVTGDTTFTAYFEANEPDGIADVYEAAGVNVKVVDGSIIVDGAEGRQVRLYDAVGRCIADSHRHHSSGIYLLQVDGLPARRVVVM